MARLRASVGAWVRTQARKQEARAAKKAFKAQVDRGVPRFRDRFTSFNRVVSGNDGRGSFLCRFRVTQAVVKAGGTTFDHARLEALLGLTIGDVSVQVLSGKQAIIFPSTPEKGLFETLPLGAQIVSALASGRRGARIRRSARIRRTWRQCCRWRAVEGGRGEGPQQRWFQRPGWRRPCRLWLEQAEQCSPTRSAEGGRFRDGILVARAGGLGLCVHDRRQGREQPVQLLRTKAGSYHRARRREQRGRAARRVC